MANQLNPHIFTGMLLVILDLGADKGRGEVY